jgi:ABC-type uncharacterized transport system auxiliary subunit
MFRQTALSVILLVACTDEPAPASTIELPKRSVVSPSADSVDAHLHALRTAARFNCQPLWPIRAEFNGYLRREIRLGPP